ncbi:MAG: sensor histidine kinase [Bacillota bacterium]|jgi:two-component system sensor histidine kinase YesM|nr:sensor histidine kinase [Bacillota bacterium]HHT91283.1 sensor histidine kinase [Bacillota bacterium]
MKTIPLRKSYSGLLILVAVIITIVTIGFMFNLYRIYTARVYSESTEVLNLYAVIANSRLAEIEDLSFEVLANRDIQDNLLMYINAINTYEQYNATNNLYTQLFTRWIRNRGVVSMSFVFLDGTRVDVGSMHLVHQQSTELAEVLQDAAGKNGSVGWTANSVGENTVTLYRLIRDISGNKFQALGTLIINVNAEHFLNHTPVVASQYDPEIICVTEDQVLTRNGIAISQGEILQSLDKHTRNGTIRLEGKSYYMSTQQLGSNGWKLIYLLPTRDLLVSIRNANIIYGVTLLIIVIILAAIGYHFANAINRPIAHLTKAMKTVQDGNYALALNDQIPQSNLAITEVVQLTEGFSRMVKEIDYLINEVYSKQLMIAKMKYNMLRQQINPHFLYNTLDTVNWKAIQSGNEEISVMVRSLSRLFRSSIKGPDMVTVQEELDLVEDYVAIQRIRFEERLEFEIVMDEWARQCPIPRLTLQPIVENCIVHNLERYSQVCKIKISSGLVNKRLEIYVEDNGYGTDLHIVEKVLRGELLTDGKSMGLRNINQRLTMSFGENFGIRLTNKEPQGTKVTIVLPCEEESHEDATDCG